jgi:hypothetical protein
VFALHCDCGRWEKGEWLYFDFLSITSRRRGHEAGEAANILKIKGPESPQGKVIAE